MQVLPLTNNFAQTFSTSLNNQSVLVRVWYQDISDGWFFSMEFTSGEKIVSGYRINTGSPILTSISSNFLGNIVCISTAEKTLEPGKESPWGETHLLLYLTQDESQEAGLENI